VEVLRDNARKRSRGNTVLALSKIKTRPEIIVPAFIDALEDSEVTVRRISALLLSEFGPAARSAIASLIKASKSEDSDTARFAQISLERIGAGSLPAAK
jgi:HEAT repeat protein